MICLTLDGATNIQGKQVINMMACGPMAFFLEHFTMELRREFADNLYYKLMDCKRRLLLTIRNLAPGFQPALDLTGILIRMTTCWSPRATSILSMRRCSVSARTRRLSW